MHDPFRLEGMRCRSIKLAGMKLLLAEDDAMLADALQTQLGRAGFEVEHAPNGAVADYFPSGGAFRLTPGVFLGPGGRSTMSRTATRPEAPRGSNR